MISVHWRSSAVRKRSAHGSTLGNPAEDADERSSTLMKTGPQLRLAGVCGVSVGSRGDLSADVRLPDASSTFDPAAPLIGL